MEARMKLKIIDTAHHRNGVAGAPFDVVLFKVHRDFGTKVAILFDEPGNCAVLDVKLLAAGDIAFGSNSWRGDHFEPDLRRAVEYRPEAVSDQSPTAEAAIERRVERSDLILRYYSDDGVVTGLIDLLADARHWCDATGEDFARLDRQAYGRYVAELNDQQTDERKIP
jgi:hypothetical protein